MSSKFESANEDQEMSDSRIAVRCVFCREVFNIIDGEGRAEENYGCCPSCFEVQNTLLETSSDSQTLVLQQQLLQGEIERLTKNHPVIPDIEFLKRIKYRISLQEDLMNISEQLKKTN